MFTKLGKTNSLGKTLTFNLPAGKTCPAAGECKHFCYAKKGRFVFGAVKEAHLRNLALSKRPDFVKLANFELARMRKRPVCIRLHSSGDVYSQGYLNKLVKLASLNPDILFYLYTKSVHFDWSEWLNLPNTKTIHSMGGKYDDTFIDGTSVAMVVDASQIPLFNMDGWEDGSEDDAVAASGNAYIILRRH